MQVLWLDIRYGQIGAGGSKGHAALVNYEGEIIWKKKGAGDESFLVRVYLNTSCNDILTKQQKFFSRPVSPTEDV